MTRKLYFLWIDDDESRKRAFDNLKGKLNVDGYFLNVKDKNLISEFDKISLRRRKFDLILIDHVLNNTEKETIQIGSTAAEYIREKKLKTPIVGITAAKLTDIDLHKKAIYDDIFEYSSISKHYESIDSIAKAYKIMNEIPPSNNESLIKILKAPEEVIERLLSIIPEDIKRNYSDDSLLFNISRWVRHELKSRPGFLYDNLWTATLLGLKEDSFQKVKHIFKKAEYKGIFFDRSDERWWQTQVREIIYARYPKDKSCFPWELGHKLPKITHEDQSVCYVCGGNLPETVGYTDRISSVRSPMHIRCSQRHPDYISSLYYEDIRIMIPAQ